MPIEIWKRFARTVLITVVAVCLAELAFGSGADVELDGPAESDFRCKAGGGEGMPVASGSGGCDGSDSLCGPANAD